MLVLELLLLLSDSLLRHFLSDVPSRVFDSPAGPNVALKPQLTSFASKGKTIAASGRRRRKSSDSGGWCLRHSQHHPPFRTDVLLHEPLQLQNTTFGGRLRKMKKRVQNVESHDAEDNQALKNNTNKKIYLFFPGGPSCQSSERRRLRV